MAYLITLEVVDIDEPVRCYHCRKLRDAGSTAVEYKRKGKVEGYFCNEAHACLFLAGVPLPTTEAR